MALTHEEKILRRSGIGGSDIGAICGLSKWRRPIDVYLDKTGEHVPDVTSEAARWGNVLEPVIADVYAEKHGAVLLGPFRSRPTDVAPWHLMTLDRLEVEPTQIDIIGIPPKKYIRRLIEIKSANWHSGQKFGHSGTDDLPLTYLAQVAWYLAGLDIEHATVAALINTSDYREYVVERDRELEGYLLERGAEFWKRVEARQPPEPDGSDSFKRYLQTRFDKTTEIVVPSSPDIDAITWQLRQAKCLARELKKRVDLFEQQLQMVIGDADAIETEHGAVKFKFDKRGRTNWKRIAETLAEHHNANLDNLAESYRSKPGRRFLTPRAWLDDELGGDLTQLLKGNHDDEDDDNGPTDQRATDLPETTPFRIG